MERERKGRRKGGTEGYREGGRERGTDRQIGGERMGKPNLYITPEVTERAQRAGEVN